MLLEAVAGPRAGALVSFNGKSFDASLLECRYLFHRLAWRGRDMPHVDVLHPARNSGNALHRSAPFGPGARAFPPSRNASADRRSLGEAVRRESAVPSSHSNGGSSAPGARAASPDSRFRVVASSCAAATARPLEAVLDHNRLDLRRSPRSPRGCA
jgi:hypothetical protein